MRANSACFPLNQRAKTPAFREATTPLASQHSACAGFGLEASDCSIISRIALLSPAGWSALAGQVRYRAYFRIYFKEVAV
jgi:hypothetical protein